MTEKKKTGICPYCGEHHSARAENLCEAEFEAWEVDYKLRERKDYEGLIAHYQAVVAWRPDSMHDLYRLGEAFVLNGEPEKAIELLAEPHRRHPENRDFQHVLLDALFALGKDETDFEWAELMPVFRLGREVLDRCHAHLKPKRKARAVDELYHQFEMEGYCLFTRDELLEAVRQDDRFVVEDEDFWHRIRVRRKRDSRKPRSAGGGRRGGGR